MNAAKVDELQNPSANVRSKAIVRKPSTLVLKYLAEYRDALIAEPKRF